MNKIKKYTAMLLFIIIITNNIIVDASMSNINENCMQNDSENSITNFTLPNNDITVSGEAMSVNDVISEEKTNNNRFTQKEKNEKIKTEEVAIKKINEQIEISDHFIETNEDSIENEGIKFLSKYTVSGTSVNVNNTEDKVVSSSSVIISESLEDLYISNNKVLEENTECKNLFFTGGTLDLNGHTLTINSNLNQKNGTININGGKLIVKGDYRIENTDGYAFAYLKMTNDKDYICVDGDFYTESYYSHNKYLTNGILEIKGNFEEKSEYYNDNFFATENHKVLLSGDKKQIVKFGRPNYSRFNYLELKNTSDEGICFESPITTPNKLSVSDTKINGLGFVGGNTFILNEDLAIDCDFYTEQSIDLNGYNLIVNGDFSIYNGVVSVNGGKLIVNGDFNISKPNADSYGRLKMVTENDYVLVNGDLNVETRNSHSSYLTNGVLELKGDFNQLLKYSSDNFRATGNHITVLNGSSAQKITFQTPNNSYFNKLEIKNKSKEGLYFEGGINSITKISFNGVRLNNFKLLGHETYKLKEDLNITGDLTVASGIDLNGHKLTVNGDLIINSGEFNLNNGEIKVAGNCYQNGGTTYINGGKFLISDDYDIGTSQSAVNVRLKMQNANDKLFVGGDFFINSQNSNSGYLSAGLFELKGDFTQIGNTGSNAYSFASSGNHTVKLSGKDIQKIYIDGIGYSKFNNLICTKSVISGYSFNYKPMWNSITQENVTNNSASIDNMNAVCKNNFIKITWDCEGAISYNVYKNGEKIAVVANESFEDRDILEGEVYSYEISANIGDNIECEKSETVNIKADFESFTDAENLKITEFTLDNEHISENHTFALKIKNETDENYICNNNEKVIVYINDTAVYEETITRDFIVGAEKTVSGTIVSEDLCKTGVCNIRVELVNNNSLLDSYNKTLELKASDLRITEIAPTSLHEGMPISINVKINNIGSISTPQNKDIIIKAIVDINGREIILTGKRPSLGSNMSATVNLNSDENGTTYKYEHGGEIKICCSVDHENDIYELNEDNNTMLYNAQIGKSDLMIEEITPNNICAGSNVSVYAKIKNISDTDLPSGHKYRIKYTLDNGSCFYSYIYNNSVLSNANKTLTSSSKFKFPLSNEEYNVKAEIEFMDDTVSEENTENNVYYFTVLPDTIAPSIPQNLIINGTIQEGFSLSWSGSSDTDEVIGYKIFRNNEEIADIPACGYTDTDIYENKSYIYYVKAYDRSGNISDKSNIAAYDIDAPEKVTGLICSNVSDGSVELSWNGSNDNTSVSKYIIFRNDVQIAETEGTTYTDSGISIDGRITYSIAAFDLYGNISEHSDIIETDIISDIIPPSIVNGLKITSRSSKSVTLSWIDATDNVGIDYYKVYRDNEEIGKSCVNTFTDTNLETGREYTYAVTAVDHGGNSSEICQGISAVPNKITIGEVTPKYGTTFGGNNSTYCYVYCVNDFNSGGLAAKIEVSKDDCIFVSSDMGSPYINSSIIRFGYNLKFADLEDGIYRIKYTVKDADGNEETADTYCYIDRKAPKKIEELTAVSENGSAVVKWKASPESDFYYYKVYRSDELNSSFKYIASIYDKNKSVYVDSSVYMNVKYNYRVTAVDKYGQESEYVQINGCLIEDDLESPTIVSIIPVDNTVICPSTTITVNADDNTAVKKITLKYSQDNENWFDIASKTNVKTANFNISGLDINGTVYIKAVAEDAMGNISDNYYVRTYTADSRGPEKIAYITPTSYSNKMLLNWADVSDEDLKYFLVEYKESSEVNFRYSKKVSDKRGTYIENLKNDTEYTFRVVAYDMCGNRGIVSDEITASTLGDTTVPVIKKITPNTGRFEGTLPLSVTATDDSGIKSVNILVSTDGGESYEKAATNDCSGKTSETLKYDLELSHYNDGIITLSAQAEDIYGNTNKVGSYICEYYVDHTAPDKPVSVSADESDEGGYIEIGWEQGKESDLLYYNVYRESDGESVQIASALKTLSYKDRDIEDGRNYTYNSINTNWRKK